MLVRSVTKEITTLMFDKKTSNYKNKYRLSGRLFADTIARRFVFYFFFHRTKILKIFADTLAAHCQASQAYTETKACQRFAILSTLFNTFAVYNYYCK